MGLSIRAYARHRGVTDTAVRKAIQTGRITPEADGTIDPEQADRDWARNTDSPRSGTKQSTPRVKAPDLNGEGGNTGNGSGTSLLQARTVNEVVKAQTNKVRLQRLKGELVDRSEAIAHVFKLARTERDAWLNWPSRVSALLASELEIDPHLLHVALENAIREHLQELGEVRIRLD